MAKAFSHAKKSLNYLSKLETLLQSSVPSSISKTMEQYVILALDSSLTTTSSFDLWISRSRHDTFSLVINFINSQQVPYHVTVGYFEVNDKIGVAMAKQVRDFMFPYNLLEKLIAYVKDEGGNMSTFV